MRELKFRAWDEESKFIVTDLPPLNAKLNSEKDFDKWIEFDNDYGVDNVIFMQFTGLKDKNGLTDVYECDIIDVDGIVIGNQYENEGLLENKTNFVIEGLGTAYWRYAEKEALARGCQYAQ